MNATMLDRQKKRLLSLTPKNKGKLLPLVMPWPFRIRQTHLWQPHLLRNSLPNYLCPLLPENNQILCGWTSLPSWLTMVS